MHGYVIGKKALGLLFDCDSLHCRALHWVTIQMLCVSMDEEIPEVSENVVKAITGESVFLNLKSKLNSMCSSATAYISAL